MKYVMEKVHGAYEVVSEWADAKVAMVVALGTAAATGAHAAVDPGVSTAITTAGTDAATVGGLVLTAIVGIFAFQLIRRALR